MKWNVMLGSLVLATGLCSHGYSFGLLDRMLGVSGCCSSSCCDSGCGAAAADCCAAPVANCCAAPATACCDTGCAAEPACGCQTASACGCHGGGLLAHLHKAGHRALQGLMSPLHSCGCSSVGNCCEPVCAVEPSCGYATGACGCHGHVGGLLDRLFCRHNHGCGCEVTCGAPVGCASCGAAPAVSQPMPGVEEAPPAPVVDPSASVRRSARVMKASLTR